MDDDIVEQLQLIERKGYGPVGSAKTCSKGADTIARQRGEIVRLRERLSRLADAADRVGIKYFDTDTMCPMVETMQAETSLARAALSDTTREK